MKSLKKLAMAAVGAAAIVTGQNVHAQQTLPFYEDFNSYTVGTLLGSAPSSTIWSQGGATGGGSPIFTNVSLSYAGLTTSGGSTAVGTSPTMSGGRNRGLNFTATTSGTLYASFLVDITGLPTTTRMFADLTSDSANSANGTVDGIFFNSAGQFGISKNSSASAGATTTGSVAVNATSLIVVAYTFNPAAGDDEFALWLNPTSLGGSAPLADITLTTGTDMANLSWFYLIQRNNTASQGS
jgi:hypothetical protein